MNAHDTNAPFRAVLGIVTHEFSRKLSFAEQEELGKSDHAKLLRYYDWLFAFNAPTAARRVMREMLGSRDHDTEYERDRT